MSTITHQACVLPHGSDVTLCYSRWTDGTYTVTVSTYRNGFESMGDYQECGEPIGVTWIDTVATLARFKEGAGT